MLKIDNLIIRTGDYDLLTTQNITLDKNESMLLVGKNNSGKSLFLKSIHKKYFNHNGNFEIKVSTFLKKKRKESILIDYENNLIGDYSIYKNITLSLLKVSDKTKELISDLCSMAKLGEIYSTKSSELSYSQTKMVEIIRAFVVEPILILIDDIDNFFDEINMNTFFELKKLSKTKSSIIATSKILIEKFDKKYRIQNEKVVIL